MFVLRFARVLFSFAIASLACSSLGVHADEPPAEPPAADAINYKELKSPIAYTEQSIKRGHTIYTRMCTECHGPDGKSQIDVIADATNLTNPKVYRSGTSEGEVFRSIKEGAGVTMPPFKMQIKNDDDFWHLTNFVRSLWPKDQQPQLQTDESPKTDDDKPADEADKSDGEAQPSKEEGDGR